MWRRLLSSPWVRTLILLNLLLITGLTLARIGNSPPPITPAPTELVPATLVPLDQRSCDWNWADSSLPETTQALTAAFQAVQLTTAELRLHALGENCVIEGSNTVERFSAAETTLHMTVPVTSLTDRAALGDTVALVVDTVAALQPTAHESIGPTQIIQLILQAEAQSYGLQIVMPAAKEARQGGLHGRALLEWLERQPATPTS